MNVATININNNNIVVALARAATTLEAEAYSQTPKLYDRFTFSPLSVSLPLPTVGLVNMAR